MARDFPVNSTSVETDAIKRVVRVLRRAKVSDHIAYGAVFNCRTIAGSSSYSQHAWGNAVDLFPRQPVGDDAGERQLIFHAIIRNTTKRTLANRGKKLAVSQVIDHSGRVIWTPSEGIHPYTGTTGDHVHVSGAPLRTGTPPCAR